jgi:SAM-dependent MidA family methyltransferase
MNTGRRWGLETTGFVRQSHFLIALGMLDRLDKAHTDTETILKIKNLFHPEGMGDVFKVLIQHKHIKNPQVSGLKALQSIKM